MRERVEVVPVISNTGKFFAQGTGELLSQIDKVPAQERGEFSDALSAVTSPTDAAVYYKENPFKVQADGQRVGFVHEDEVRHVVGSEDFFNLAHNVIGGGLMGWGKHGTYPEVIDAAIQIDAALSRAE